MSLCLLCNVERYEGNVCHSCRNHFKPYLLDESEFDYDLTCVNCDEHGFPCLNCSHYSYEGFGNGENIYDLSEFSESAPISPYDYVLIVKVRSYEGYVEL